MEKEIAECSICFNLFTDPRMLPCYHTFCLKCLIETAVKAECKPGDAMPCPLCRTLFTIPNEGIAGLKKNFFVDKMLQVAKILKPSDKQKPCDICIKKNQGAANEIPAATQICIQCHKNICERCSRDHKRFQALKDHELVPIDSLLLEDIMKRAVTQLCAQHNMKELEMFCSNCKEAICVICFAEKHNSHKCSGIEKAAEQFHAEISEELKKLRKLSAGEFKKYQQIIDEQKKFCESVKSSEEAIIKRGNRLKEMIDRCTKSLLDELSSIKQQEMKKLETEKEESERHKTTVESLISFSDRLISKRSSVEICVNISDLQTRIENVQRLTCQYIQKDPVSTAIVFQSSELEGFLKTDNIVGILKAMKAKVKSLMMDEEKAAENNKCYIPVAIRSNSRLHLMDNNSYVREVTKLMNEIYVLTFAPKQVLVFKDQQPYQFQKRLKIREIEQPENMETSKTLKSLFIFDSKIRCIWKMTLDNNRIVKWLSNVSNLFKMSPIIDDQLLVLTTNASGNQLFIMGSHTMCHLVRNIPLPSDIVDPSCCVQTENGDFIISHRHGQSGHRTISQLSSDGQNIIRQITSENDAFYSSLFLDSENNRLFGVDCRPSKDRIVLFDSNSLELKQILLTKQEHGTHYPFRLFYDSEKMKLFVWSTYDWKFVNVYDLCMAGTT